MRWLFVGALGLLGLVGCTSTVVIMEEVPTSDPTEAELCSANRDPDFPCITAEGRGLRWGECCVDANGDPGTCDGYDADGGQLQIPWCNSKL